MCKDRGYNSHFLIKESHDYIIRGLYAEKESLCNCRHRILKIMWLTWISWMYKVAYDVIVERKDPEQIDKEFIRTHNKIKDLVFEDKNTDNEIAKAFFGLFDVVIEEYAGTMKKFDETDEAYVNRIAQSFQNIFDESFFAMKQLIIYYDENAVCEKCGTPTTGWTCPYGKTNCQNCPLKGCVTIRATSLFFVNSYVKNKIEKLAEILKENGKNPKEIFLAFDLGNHYKLANLDKFWVAVEIAKQLFHEVKVIMTSEKLSELEDLAHSIKNHREIEIIQKV